MGRTVTAMLTLSLLVGCEPEEPVPPPEIQQPAAPAGPTRPTTQELVDGPRHELSLGSLPATISVPKSWELRSPTGQVPITVLAGPTPTGEAVLRLLKLNKLSPQTHQLYLDKVRQEAADSATMLFFEIRDEGGFKVIESVRPGSDSTVDWKLRLLASNGLDFDQYEVSFLALPRSVYDADADFLRSLLRTIRLSDSAAAPPR